MGNRLSRKVSVGRVDIGGGAGVSVQSMSNADPHDAAAIIAQAEKCERAGCDIFRLTVPDAEAAKTLGEVKKAVSMPIVADIHFDWRLALAAIDAGCDALRLNPGNIGSPERVRTVASAASARGVPIRVGVNLGSLEKDLDASLRSGRISAAEALAASAMRHVGILEEADFRDVVISAKASNDRHFGIIVPQLHHCTFTKLFFDLAQCRIQSLLLIFKSCIVFCVFCCHCIATFLEID